MFKHLLMTFAAPLAAFPAEARPQAAPPPAAQFPLFGFAQNQGQWNGAVQFGGRAGRTGVSFEPGAVTWWPRRDGGRKPESVRLLEGRPLGPWVAGSPSPGTRAYFLGDDPARWRSHVPAFTSLACGSTDGRVTITALEEPEGLGLEFHVVGPIQEAAITLVDSAGAIAEGLAPGVARFVLADGACTVRLRHVTVVGADGSTRECSGRMSVASDGRLRLDVADLPSGFATLVVNTSLEWSTYLGGSDVERVHAVAWADAGEVIIGGTTESGDFPASAGAFDPTANPCLPSCGGGIDDVFAARVSGDGSAVVWATYLGGTLSDHAATMHVGLDGEVTVFGWSGSTDFPTTQGVVQPIAPSQGIPGDGFVTRLTADGSHLVYSTYFGGVDLDVLEAGAVAPDGTILVAGSTTSASLPAVNGPSAGASALSDVFVARLLPDASGVVFSIQLEGKSIDNGRDVDVLSDGRVVVVGNTLSDDFPYTPGAFGTTTVSGFVATLDGGSGALLACTALGGEGSDVLYQVKVDAFDRIFVAGQTTSQDFPTTPDAYQTSVLSTTTDGFVSCFDPSLATLLHSTCFGSVGSDAIRALHLSPSGLVTVGGWTGSPFLPVTPGAFDTTLGGPSATADAFVARLDRNLTTLHYCTYLGGIGTENLSQGHTAVDVAPDGRVAVAVGTASADFPVTPGAIDTQLSGNTDAAVLVMDLLPTGVQRVGTSTPGSAGPLPMGVTSQPYIGSETFALHGGGAPPGSHRGLLLLSLEAPGQPVTLGGAALWVDPATLFLVLPVHSDSYGYVQVPLRMPTDPAAAGLQACGQFAWRDPGAMPGPWAASHALRITLQP